MFQCSIVCSDNKWVIDLWDWQTFKGKLGLGKTNKARLKQTNANIKTHYTFQPKNTYDDNDDEDKVPLCKTQPSFTIQNNSNPTKGPCSLHKVDNLSPRAVRGLYKHMWLEITAIT